MMDFQIFLHKSAMQHHAREIHRGEVKPHQCQQCLKSFSSNHQLTQHIRIHTGEKPYKCSYCDRRFKQLSHVQQHTRLHTGKSNKFIFSEVKQRKIQKKWEEFIIHFLNAFQKQSEMVNKFIKYQTNLTKLSHAVLICFPHFLNLNFYLFLFFYQLRK